MNLSHHNIEPLFKDVQEEFQEIFVSMGRLEAHDGRVAPAQTKKQYFKKNKTLLLQRFINEYLKATTIAQIESTNKIDDWTDWVMETVIPLDRQKQPRQDFLKSLADLIQFPERRDKIYQEIKKNYNV